jgi:hypothetical protein
MCQARVVLVGAAAGGLWLLAACARDGLDAGDLEPSLDPSGMPAPAPTADPAPSATAAAGAAGAPMTMPVPTATATTTSGSTEPSPPPTPSGSKPGQCTPAPETCNGLDDDCNGQVDDLPAVACAGGGFQYCVAGKLSSCPRSCEVCVPGSVRVCQNSYCTFWGEQECTADGQGFGPCREAKPPPRCAAIAAEEKDSAELEQCCIDDGYCCVDSHDLDGDGNEKEMLGACEGVRCP